ncbi:ferritin-like domain-containing protein [Arthrobacter sp. NPDC093125]|uniref:ferritin-like domain-containing protein n=1 Tax=Arthrobacter sp. NPDC093125 TaxID=3363944 RepID=UPI003802BCE8
MKKDTRESGRTTGYFRYALAAFTALLVLSLGFALIPRPVPEPAAPPFSEQARAAALAETMRLRAAGQQLAEGSSGARRQAFSRTVTLLTIQARALFLPSDDPSRAAADRPAGAASGSAPASAGASAAAPATTAPATAAPATAQALVAGLSASGKLRLAHAQTADGGMARLLSSVGTAQLLQAAALAQASGTPAPAMPSAAALPAAPALPSATALPSNSALPSASTQAPAPSASCQPSAREGATDPAALSSQAPAASAAAPAASGTESTQPASDASTVDALAQVVRTELETVYGYQVALTRLEGPAVQQATDLLSRHEAAVTEAEARSRLSCAEVPPREPGYTLDATFLNNPTAGLASLEAGTLPVYGDLVALSEGATRQWAIASLVAAAQRTVRWGSDPGPVPGLVLDTSQLPPLPEAAAPSISGTALPG